LTTQKSQRMRKRRYLMRRIGQRKSLRRAAMSTVVSRTGTSRMTGKNTATMSEN
jgi:hypothetical protein